MAETLVERLRKPCLDWDGTQIPDLGEPIDVMCGTLREAADALEELSEATRLLLELPKFIYPCDPEIQARVGKAMGALSRIHGTQGDG